jgi:hypothetical protein
VTQPLLFDLRGKRIYVAGRKVLADCAAGLLGTATCDRRSGDPAKYRRVLGSYMFTPEWGTAADNWLQSEEF